MDEYISRNELLKDVNSNVAEADNERCAQILEVILNAPIADVVPKSEVEAEFEKRLAKYQDEEKCIYTYDGEIFDYCVQGPCPHHKVLEEVRREVAREIFEDFTKHRVCTNEEDFRVLAELKKKYTEGEQCPDCKHFVGCEEAVWSGRCEDFDSVRKEDEIYEKGYNDALKDVEEMILERKNENTPKT